MHADWLVPVWPAPPAVRAVCTTRAGGVSERPFAGLNLGDHVGDASPAVAQNRALLQTAIGARPVFLSQVHGTTALALDTSSSDGMTADASWTTAPGLACTIMVADCLPVLLTDTRGCVVAAAHAGWRGLAGVDGVGVLERLVSVLRAQTPHPMLAWLGPCIGPTAFEVGPEVREIFVAHDTAADNCFRPAGTGKWWADLAQLARQRLHAVGVDQVFGNDSGLSWCTVQQPARYFSYRRDRVTGRFAASIWRTV